MVCDLNVNDKEFTNSSDLDLACDNFNDFFLINVNHLSFLLSNFSVEELYGAIFSLAIVVI